MRRLAVALACAMAAGCASVSVELAPEGAMRSLCGPASSSTLVLWQPQWRADQKEPEAREAIADRGLRRVVESGDCLGPARLHRLRPGDDTVKLTSGGGTSRVLLVTVRELGPVLKLGSGAALVEGGTEVVLDLHVALAPAGSGETRSIRWREGGPGVVKGVATLEDDIAAAFRRLLEGRAAP